MVNNFRVGDIVKSTINTCIPEYRVVGINGNMLTVIVDDDNPRNTFYTNSKDIFKLIRNG